MNILGVWSYLRYPLRFLILFYHTHPTSDGSRSDWAGLRAYTLNVGIPMAIATVAMAKGRVKKTGVLIPEEAFCPEYIPAELEKHEIYIHEEIEELPEANGSPKEHWMSVRSAPIS